MGGIRELKVMVQPIATAGAKGRSPQDAPIWHKDYFELKANKSDGLKGNICSFFNYIEECKLRVFPRISIITRYKFI